MESLNVETLANLPQGFSLLSDAMLLYLQLSVHFLFLISPALPIIATTPSGSGELEIGTSGANSSKDKTMHGSRGAHVDHGDHHSESEIASSAKKKIVRFGRGEGRSMEEDTEWSEPQIKDSGVDTGSSTTLNEEHNLVPKVRA